MKKQTLTATTPRGTFTRQTHRNYTHIAVFLHPDDGVGQVLWCGSAALAQKAKPNYYGPWPGKKEIYPIDQTPAVDRVKIKSDGGCGYRELENGYCVNTGKVQEYDPEICCTTCDKCYYKNDKPFTGIGVVNC